MRALCFAVCVLPGTVFRLRRIVAIWMDSYACTQVMHLVYPIVSVGDGNGGSTDQTMTLKRPYHSRSRRYALNLFALFFGRYQGIIQSQSNDFRLKREEEKQVKS